MASLCSAFIALMLLVGLLVCKKSDELLVWLSLWSEVQMIWIWSMQLMPPPLPPHHLLPY